ncbi:MAG: hypothetical protein ACEROO_10330, partial [Candidatus Bathyarchaeota archaeon]
GDETKVEEEVVEEQPVVTEEKVVEYRKFEESMSETIGELAGGCAGLAVEAGLPVPSRANDNWHPHGIEAP